MTDAPDGPAEGEAERGARRTSRVGDSGSPVGSTLSIVLAVLAVIAGFLILRAITDDDSDAGGLNPAPGDSSGTPGTGSAATPGAGDSTVAPTSTQPTRTGATVVVANASGVQGSAAGMTQALQSAGYTMGTATNTNAGTLAASVVYYVDGDPAALAVATSVAADMGGLQTQPMPVPPPIEGDLAGATVLVMVGTDTAGKTLPELNPAGVTTTSAAG